jgi:hypothetical protein
MPTRHNLMAVYVMQNDHRHPKPKNLTWPLMKNPDGTMVNADTMEIADCQWVNLPEFVAAVDDGRAPTKPSVMLAVEMFIETIKEDSYLDEYEWTYCTKHLEKLRPFASLILRNVCMAWMYYKRRLEYDMSYTVDQAAKLIDTAQEARNVQWL